MVFAMDELPVSKLLPQKSHLPKGRLSWTGVGGVPDQ